MDQGLQIGEDIKIPLGAGAFAIVSPEEKDLAWAYEWFEGISGPFAKHEKKKILLKNMVADKMGWHSGNTFHVNGNGLDCRRENIGRRPIESLAAGINNCRWEELYPHVESRGVKPTLVIADPPYGIGYKYDLFDDSMSPTGYLNWMETLIKRTYTLLTPDGSFYLFAADEHAAELKSIANRHGFTLRNWIIWHFEFGQNQRTKFTRSHVHIFYFVKSIDPIWNPYLVPSKRQTVYNDSRGNPEGKVLDDVWDVPRVCGTFDERVEGFPCQIPEENMRRIILSSSNPGDLIVDPFCGSGTTKAVAEKLERKCITSDISLEYCELAAQRIYGDPCLVNRI